jgi:hypothetical protein
MFGGETVSLFAVLAGVLKGHFGKMFSCPSKKIVQHNQAIIALLIRQSFLLVLVRIQVGPPTSSLGFSSTCLCLRRCGAAKVAVGRLTAAC